MDPAKNGTGFRHPGNRSVLPVESVAGTRVAGGGGRGHVRLIILGLLVLLCALIYYFGEIVDFFSWNTLRWEFFYSVHDVQRLLFLAPVIYAAYRLGTRATIITTLIASMIMLPRALFVSPYPDPLLRMSVSILIIGIVGYLVATNRRLETSLARDRDMLIGILERMEDGVVIIGSDYRVRFTNATMSREFGVSVGSTCYQSIYDLGSPCPEICRLKNVLAGSVERWQYIFPDGRSYEIVASPFVDRDGTVCSLATYRDIFASAIAGK